MSAQVSNFAQVRRDGRVISEAMTAQEIRELGWPPDKIDVLTWSADSKTVELKSRYGFLSRVVPNREYVAVLEDVGREAKFNVLKIFSADGSLKWEMPNTVWIAGRLEEGRFQWFEPARAENPGALGVVFLVFRNNGMWQVDLDADTSAVLGVYETR